MSASAVLRLLRSPDTTLATRRQFDTIVRASLQPVTIGLAILFAFFAATHAALLEPPTATVLTSVAGGLAAIYLLLSIELRTWRIPLRWTHPLAALLVGGALGHALLHLYLAGDPRQTTNVALIVLGSSLLFLSVRWLALIILVALVSWSAIALQSAPSSDWLHFAFLLSATAALGLTINAVRFGMQQRLEDLRRQDAHRTQQLQATTKLALESEARFRTVIQTAGSAIVALTADYITLEFNNTAEQLYGWQRAKVIGQDIRQWAGTTDALEPLIAHIAPVLAGTPARNIESRVRGTDGLERTLLWNVTRFDDSTGRPAGVIAIGQDISARKQAEEAQRFLSDVSRVLVSSLNDAALVQTVARLAVPQFADWCSVTLFRADEISPDVSAVVHVDPVKEVQLRELHQQPEAGELSLIGAVRRMGQPQLFPACTDVLAEGLPHTQPERGVLAEIGCASAIAAPLVARGEIRGVLVFAVSASRRSYVPDDIELVGDLAGRIALAVDNARLYRNVQQALRARDEFLSVAAHELKTPLVALVGATQLFEGAASHTPVPNEFMQRQLYVIGKATQRLHKLIDSLIEFTQIQAGTLDLQRKQLDLGALTQRVVEAAQPSRRHHIEVRVPHAPLLLEADGARLELALYNLVQNAIKYSPRGGQILVTVGQDNAHAWVSVRDQGIGIPRAAQQRLFERFYRAGNVNSEQIAGMGIGLHLVQEIVSRHGGVVDLASVEGQGSTFTVRLPLHQLPASATAPAESVTRQTS